LNMYKILQMLEENFQKRLMVKTGWGRNEIMTEYHKAVIDTLASAPDSIVPIIIPKAC
jgi:hypothetical protein